MFLLSVLFLTNQSSSVAQNLITADCRSFAFDITRLNLDLNLWNVSETFRFLVPKHKSLEEDSSCSNGNSFLSNNMRA